MQFAFLLIAALSCQFSWAAGTTLFIGDSHSVMSFGRTLAKDLGPEVKRYAVASTAAGDWLNPTLCTKEKPCEFIYGYSTPKGDFQGKIPDSFPGIGRLLKRHNPERVIIALGTNDLSQRCKLPEREGMAPFKKLLEQIGNRECVWVGPPSFTHGPVFESCGSSGAFNDFVDNLNRTVSARGCKFIDSRKILALDSQSPISADLPDEVHFSEELGAHWADEVAKKLLF